MHPKGMFFKKLRKATEKKSILSEKKYRK